ncbi:MAG: hypothetical protein ACRD4T_14665, partial [Candidatus Acidiferrales bacterium]
MKPLEATRMLARSSRFEISNLKLQIGHLCRGRASARLNSTEKARALAPEVAGRILLLLALALLPLLALPTLAESTRFWRQANYADFDKGTASGVALRSDGELVLA